MVIKIKIGFELFVKIYSRFWWVERKLLVLMYSLWKNEIDYDAKYEQKKTARTEVLAAQDRSNLALTSS